MKAHLLDLIDNAFRILKTFRIKVEMEPGVGILPGAAVKRDGIAGHAVTAHRTGGFQKLGRRLIIGFRQDRTQAPQWRHHRPAGETRIALQYLLGRFAGNEEQINRLIFYQQAVRAV